jgi:hypothetical protein
MDWFPHVSFNNGPEGLQVGNPWIGPTRFLLKRHPGGTAMDWFPHVSFNNGPEGFQVGNPWIGSHTFPFEEASKRHGNALVPSRFLQ